MSCRGEFGIVRVLDPEGRSARIFARPGTDDDIVIDEVWYENVYRMHSSYVKHKTVVDVGANIGAFSVWAAAAGAHKVVAFEPDPVNFQQLESNAAKFNIERHQVALAGSDGRGSLENPDATASGSGFLVDGSDFEVRSFASVLNEVGPIAVLKMDIEGGEYSCFDSIDAAALSNVERIAMEFHGPELNVIEDFSARFGHMVTVIAEWGHLEVLGRPSVGGMIYGVRY